MHITLGIQWFADGRHEQEVDERLFTIIREINEAGSIAMAADNVGVSYRFAWGLIKKWEKHFNHALIHTRRGTKRGAQLTEFGQTLLLGDSDIRQRLQPILQDHADRLNNSLNELTQTSRKESVKLFASHDLAINHLVELFGSMKSWQIQHEVRGSLNNLRALVNHHCDIAGFHFPLDFPDTDLTDPYRQYLRLANADCLALATRQQGLIVQKGNPRNIKSIRDLTKRSVRFINRQPQSGTRILIDALLEHEAIRPAQISGYVNEEFTHLAVAAMVASGATDAGIGLKAAAHQFKLTFVPIIRERYCLALSPRLDKRMKTTIKKMLSATKFREKIGKIPGYETSDTGKEVPLSRLFE